MVTNFEEITEDLNEKDKFFEPFVFAALRTLDSEKKCTKGKDIVDQINYQLAHKYGPEEAKFSEVRLRKFVNYFRVNGLMPVCATSDGYFITFENEILKKQVKSLKERASGIYAAAQGLEKWIK